MDADEMMLFIKANPDTSINELADRFRISSTRAASDANKMVKTGWLIKNHVRSMMNSKSVIAYRVHPDWNSVRDNADGSMKESHVIRILRIQYRHRSRHLALSMLNAHNSWRKANNKELINFKDVINE